MKGTMDSNSPTKVDIVWMIESDKVIQSRLTLHETKRQQEARLDWQMIPEGSYELYAGEDLTGPRFTIYILDQIKSVEEYHDKKLNFQGSIPVKHVLKLTYTDGNRDSLKICFQQKEDLKSWLEAIRNVLESGKKQRKKLEKEYKETLKKGGMRADVDSTYASISPDETTAFEVETGSTAASIRNDVVGDGALILSKNHITLANKMRSLCISWHYKHVRRFGYSSTSFTLEGGQKSGTKGQGVFIFNKCPGNAIKQCIQARVTALKEGKDRVENEYTSDGSDCGDYTENIDRIYLDIRKFHKKLNNQEQDSIIEQSKGKTTHLYEFYATGKEAHGKPTKNVPSNTGDNLPPKILPKIVLPKHPKHIVQLVKSPPVPLKPQRQEVKSSSDTGPRRFSGDKSGAKMSEVVQALTKQCNDTKYAKDSEYSALSFCSELQMDPSSDLSLATGNLYGDALCHQTGLRNQDQGVLSCLDSTYSEVDYNKEKILLKKKCKK